MLCSARILCVATYACLSHKSQGKPIQQIQSDSKDFMHTVILQNTHEAGAGYLNPRSSATQNIFFGRQKIQPSKFRFLLELFSLHNAHVYI